VLGQIYFPSQFKTLLEIAGVALPDRIQETQQHFVVDLEHPTVMWSTSQYVCGQLVIARNCLSEFGMIASDHVFCDKIPTGSAFPDVILSSFSGKRHCPFCLERRQVCNCPLLSRIRSWQVRPVPSFDSWVSLAKWYGRNSEIPCHGSFEFRGKAGTSVFAMSDVSSVELHGNANPAGRLLREAFLLSMCHAAPVERSLVPSSSMAPCTATTIQQDRRQIPLFSNLTETTFETLGSRESSFSHKCDQCPRSFATRSNLFRHQRQKHSRSPTRYRTEKKMRRLHPCSLCGQTFTQKWNLSRHLLDVHSRAKFFACPQCSRQFSQKENRDRHVRLRHQEETDQGSS